MSSLKVPGGWRDAGDDRSWRPARVVDGDHPSQTVRAEGLEDLPAAPELRREAERIPNRQAEDAALESVETFPDRRAAPCSSPAFLSRGQVGTPERIEFEFTTALVPAHRVDPTSLGLPAVAHRPRRIGFGRHARAAELHATGTAAQLDALGLQPGSERNECIVACSGTRLRCPSSGPPRCAPGPPPAACPPAMTLQPGTSARPFVHAFASVPPPTVIHCDHTSRPGGGKPTRQRSTGGRSAPLTRSCHPISPWGAVLQKRTQVVTMSAGRWSEKWVCERSRGEVPPRADPSGRSKTMLSVRSSSRPCPECPLRRWGSVGPGPTRLCGWTKALPGGGAAGPRGHFQQVQKPALRRQSGTPAWPPQYCFRGDLEAGVLGRGRRTDAGYFHGG